MTHDSDHDPARRGFIQLAVAGAGALTALPGLTPNALARDVGDEPQAARAGIVASADRVTPIKDHETINLNGTWSVIALPLEAAGAAGYKSYQENAASESLAAQVPGEIHLDLMRAGKMVDPNISDNARAQCRWPEKHSWWYCTTFELPTEFRKNMRQRLIFDGIDLYGQVFVNGELAGETKDAFAILEFDVVHLLRDGVNELVVRVTSGMELIPSSAYQSDDRDIPWKLKNSERSFIHQKHRFLRKPAYSAYGWDSCDPLPNIGIWRGVRLQGRSQVIIGRLRLDTVIHDKEVALEGEAILENLHPWSEIQSILELHLQPPKGEPIVRRLRVGALPGRFSVPCKIVISNPQLWWPLGMGEQPLYQLTASVVCGDRETDRQERTIGLRTIRLDRSLRTHGSRFCFLVNGQPVFCTGSNWAPADLIPARIDAHRYQQLIAEATNARIRMLRVNGCSFYESDHFYDACDRAGILVWQDFPFTLFLYPDRDPHFVETVRGEARAAIRRLRHHPSLAVWCGGNEGTAFIMSESHGTFDPTGRHDLGGSRIYNDLLPELCLLNDPERPYLPNSPIGGPEPNGGMAGDRHGPYGLIGIDAGEDSSNGGTELSDEMKLGRWQELSDAYRARFVSEFGVIGPPMLDSVREYLRPDELFVGSAGWEIHTNSLETASGPVSSGIRWHYGEPNLLSLADFILYGQMYQAQLIAAFVEARRFLKDDPQAECQGVMNWSFNDTWGEMGWSIIDYYLRRKASYYWYRSAAATVKILVRTHGGFLVTRVVNDSLKTYRALVQCGWMRIDGSASELRRYPVKIPVNGMIEVARVPIPGASERDPRQWLYAATLSGHGLPDDQALWLLAPHRQLALSRPDISTKPIDGILEVGSSTYCHGVHIADLGHEVLVTNYFDLLPGITRRIRIATPSASGTYPLTVVMPIGASS